MKMEGIVKINVKGKLVRIWFSGYGEDYSKITGRVVESDNPEYKGREIQIEIHGRDELEKTSWKSKMKWKGV